MLPRILEKCTQVKGSQATKSLLDFFKTLKFKTFFFL